MNYDVTVAHWNRQTQSLMNVEEIIEIVSSAVHLAVDARALSRSFDIAIINLVAETNLQVRMNLRSPTLRHRVPDHFWTRVHRFGRISFGKPFLGQFEHIGDFFFGEMQSVVISRDDQRVPSIVFEGVRRGVRQTMFETAERIFGGRTETEILRIEKESSSCFTSDKFCHKNRNSFGFLRATRTC